VLVTQGITSNDGVHEVMRVLVAPVGTGGDAHLVETIAATQDITFVQQPICCGL